MNRPSPSPLDGRDVGTLLQHPGIELCDDIDGLAAIGNPDTDLVIWRRPEPLCLRTWLERLAPATLPDLRLLVRPSQTRMALEPHFDALGVPKDDIRTLLMDDIEALVAVFSRITDVDCVDVRLEPVTHNACWKFHRDFVEARLLTTYLGPATEWVENSHADQALRDQKEYQGPLERLRTHDVAFFKGHCAESGNGIVHRSPPIAGTGETRFLLCLNKRSIASPEPWQGDAATRTP